MAPACMLNNKANGVECPLADTVRSVHSEHDPVGAAQIRAEEAASLILEVVNSDTDDDSIKFGVNARLRQQLLENRVTSTRVVEEIRETSTPQIFSSPDTLQVVHTSRSEQPSTPAFASDSEDSPQPPPISEARIEHSLGSLLTMMGEMRSAIDRISSPTASIPLSTRSAWIPVRSAHQHSRMLETRSTTSLTVQRVAHKLQQYGRPTEGQLGNPVRQSHQLHSQVIWVTDGASRSDDAASARSQPPVDLHKRVLLQKTRQTSFTARQPVASKLAAPSPTQFADQLFGTRRRIVFFRHPAESGDSPYLLASLSAKK